MIRRQLTYLLLSATAVLGAAAQSDITISNGEFSLGISADGLVKSLVYLPSGEECLAPDVDIPVSVITQYRPYDNENFLMFPAKPRSFPSNKATMSGDTLILEFSDTYDIAKIKVDVRPEYIGFNFVDRDYRIEDYGVKRKTELDEFTLLQLPLKPRERFGEWLNIMWDDSVAVALVGTAPTTFIDSRVERDNTTLLAQTQTAVRLYDSGAALFVTRPDSVLARMDAIEEDFDMPRGVRSRLSADYPKSYYELRDVTLDNIDHNIDLARQAGLQTMVVYYPDFAEACGHFEWRPEYPRGMADLKEICDRIRQAGLIPGIHIHYSKMAVTDPYINDGHPDRRGAVVSRYTLSRPVTADADTIYVEELPENVRMEDGRRLLQLDDELIMFGDVVKQYPYAFTGCQRGVYNSVSAPHAAMSEARHLDVDDWPLFIRVDQNTGIQREIAERLGKIYADCGFRFVYFDGAEDVPMPYWYNVSRSQLEVYNAMHPAPLFAEGAQKSHYGWHILSRGNAFDIFPPERIRTAMKRYTLRCARQVACDFTSVNFGWVNYLAPSEKTIGMQPDMFDYICSKALAWDSPISLVANVPEIDRHPRTDDNLLAINLWETLKLDKSIDPQLKEALRDPDREFTILPRKGGKVEILEVSQLTPDSLNASMPVRAFTSRLTDGRTAIIYWDSRGKSQLTLPPTEAKVSLQTFDGKTLKIKRDKDGNRLLPADSRRVLVIDLPVEQASELFNQAISTYKPYHINE
ncbi:MAG: hypothetical protein K2I64_04165 [Muribaculaceae bacterium]|nr:hypothetical protein [Muribaculaceae bacterium]